MLQSYIYFFSYSVADAIKLHYVIFFDIKFAGSNKNG